MRGLRAAASAATAPIAGFHLFPFGGLRKAGGWLRDYANAAGEGALRTTERAMSQTSSQKP